MPRKPSIIIPIRQIPFPTARSPVWPSLYRSDYSSTGSYYGTLIATYKYDPWGKPTGIYSASGSAISQTADNVAAYNPFRYRGYHYDADTGFYYLRSRYYDPIICRFINADAFASTGQGFLGHNMFAYCNNGPANYSDLTGYAISGVYTCVMSDSGSKKMTPPSGCFTSMDAAAMAFVSNNYGKTQNKQREYGAYIFAREWNGMTIYFLGDSIEGTYYDVWLYLTPDEAANVANGIWFVYGMVHTHVDNTSFSSTDHKAYNDMQQPFTMYVGNSNRKLYRYDNSSSSKHGDCVGSFVTTLARGKGGFFQMIDARLN